MLCFILCLSVCVCIRNGDLKLSCSRNCDSLQVHREWGGDGDSFREDGDGDRDKISKAVGMLPYGYSYKLPVPDRLKQSFVIFVIWAL